MFGASRIVGALALALAGLLAFAAAPAAATADEYTSPQPSEEDTPPPLLEVTTTSHYEPEDTSEPGQTELNIEALFSWNVTVTVRAHGTTVFFEEPENTDLIAAAGVETNAGLTVTHVSSVPWSCKQPGAVYSYMVTATTRFGEEPPPSESGSFTGASQRQCKEARRLSVRRHREEVREQHAQERRKLEEELASDRRYEANCRKVGGKPVTIQTIGRPELVCRSQTGGIVEA